MHVDLHGSRSRMDDPPIFPSSLRISINLYFPLVILFSLLQDGAVIRVKDSGGESIEIGGKIKINEA